MPLDRCPHRRPCHPQLTSERRRCRLDTGDTIRCPPAHPLGQRVTWQHELGSLLGPGLHRTQHLAALPDPLAPAQRHRPLTRRRLAHGDPTPILRSRDHPASLAADPLGIGLDLDHHVELVVVHRKQPEPGRGEPHHPCTTFPHGGLLEFRTVRQSRDSPRPPPHIADTAPSFNA